MDTKSKNINREEENKLDIKKEKSNSKRTFKKNSNKKYIIYILTVIVLVTAILSGLEVKDNLGYVIPDKIYTQTEVADNISYYTSLVEKYSLYYKSSTYAKNKDNITKNDIEICKSELQDKANAEYEDYRNSKYNDDSFNNLTYEQQEKILNEEQEKINEKYTLSDEEMNEYILNRKSNSASDLNNKIKSYVNLNFRSYDKLNDLWIGGNEIDPSKVRATSRYFKEINIDYNGNIIEKIYVNGKEIDKNNALNRFVDNYSYGSRYIAYSSYETTSNTERSYYDYNNEDKHNVTLYIWMPKELQSGDVVYESFINVQKNVNSFYLSCIVFVVFFVLLILCILYLAKYKPKSELLEGIVNKLKVQSSVVTEEVNFFDY